MFYIVIFMFLAILSFLEVFSSIKKKFFYLFLLVVTIFFILSFVRWQRGTDWTSYQILFVTSVYSASAFFEIGFAYLAYIIRSFTDNYTIFLFIEALILFTLKYPVIYKLSPYPLFSLLVSFGLYFGDIFFVRQNIASAILFTALIFIIYRRPVVFTLLVLVATLIHSSSLIFLFAYKCYYLRLNKKTFIIVLLTSAISILLLGFLVDNLFVLFASLNIPVIAKASLYFNTTAMDPEAMAGGHNPLLLILQMLFTRLILVYFIFLISLRIKNYEAIKGFINLYFFGCLVFAIAGSISIPLSRLGFVFFPIEVLFIPAVMNNNFSFGNRILIFIVLVCYLLVKLLGMLNGNYGELYVPYKAFWETTPVTFF